MHALSTFQAALDAAGISFIERGWLSANNTLILGDGPSALVDSGYCIHAQQTVALVRQALGGRTLDLLLNTHLHSDHCGGNAALQAEHPDLQVFIPPGHAQAVEDWDPVELTFEPTGQACPRFTHQAVLRPGSDIQLGTQRWEIHAAKGHDPHSIVLFQPDQRILISADALWENGFGVVFPELEGVSAFDEVGATLDAIEALNPLVVLPGHGSIFTDVTAALGKARSRLEQFVKHPEKHQRHAVKVLLKYKLLEWQKVSKEVLLQWTRNTAYIRRFIPEQGNELHQARLWLDELLAELERSGALRMENEQVLNS